MKVSKNRERRNKGKGKKREGPVPRKERTERGRRTISKEREWKVSKRRERTEGR